MANSVDPDQMPQSVASDQGLHCLHGPICPKTKGYYSSQSLAEMIEYLNKLLCHEL